MWWYSHTKCPVVAPAMFNFMPSWWHHEFGISYGERLFTDPDHRDGTAREMRRLAYSRFGDIGIGEADPQLEYIGLDLLNASVPSAFGADIIYSEDNYPDCLPVSEDKLESLTVPSDITELHPMREAIRQSDYSGRRYGQDFKPWWNCMGLQNVGVKLRGADFFLDYYTNPELVDKLLSSTAKLAIASIDYFISRGLYLPYLWVANCTVPMVGPRGYEEWLLPREQDLAIEAGKRGLDFGVHHCGIFDDYCPLYRKISNVVWLEIGSGSDLRLALDTFPDAHVQYIVSHELVRSGTPSTIADAMRTIVDVAGLDVARLSFNIADLDNGVPDENVRAVVEGLLPQS